MAWAECAFMGAVQGLTEFLPVSSSGHLRLLEGLLGTPGGVPKLTLEVLLHGGTLVAVCFWLRAELARLARALPRLPAALVGLVRGAPPGDDPAGRSLAAVVVASVPTAIIALGLKKAGIEDLGAVAVALGLVGSGLLNRTVRGSALAAPEGPPGAGLTLGRALAVGAVQGLAALPGLSRSASTIAASVAAGLHPVEAARFSFLLAIPVVGGATLLEARHLAGLPLAAEAVGPIALGAAAACVVGFLSLRWLVTLLTTDRFHWFSWYCFAVAAAVLGLVAWGGGA